MSRGRAKLAITQGLSVWVMEALEGFGDQAFHAHHAIQLTLCFEGHLALEGEAVSLAGPALIVAPDAPHKLDARGLIAVVFVEPESALGRTLYAERLAGAALAPIEDARFVELANPLRRTFAAALTQEQMLEIGWAAVGALVAAPRADPPDERIQRIIDYAARHLDQPLTLAAASAGVFLSESRLRHLFVEQTGLAFKTYLLWLRLVRAVQIYSQGQSLTEAAHAAGFADSAHFSRVFKRTFGTPATTLTRL